ncbi:DUF5960 family protein [Globicatella sanguinis]
MRLNYQCDKDFYPNDMSGMRFESDYTRLINTIYPAWSVEEHFIKHMKKQGEPYLYFKPEETFDDQPHIFRFEIVTDQQYRKWYKYLGVK